jgi:hypothetical protein
MSCGGKKMSMTACFHTPEFLRSNPVVIEVCRAAGLVQAAAACSQLLLVLESWAFSATSSIQQVGNHENSNNQPDGAYSPSRTETPIQTASSTKKQQQHYQDN